MFRFIPLIFLLACTPLAQTGTDSYGTSAKPLRLADAVYESQIRTVRLYSPSGDPRSEILPAVTKRGNWSLVLEFDDLREQRDSYYATIIHCRYDWTRSNLSDLDFMPEFNEYPINTFEYSLDTQIPYVHYQFKLPAVKLPGNYVLMVFRGSDREDIVLTRRFMVYDAKVSIAREGNLVGSSNVARVNQQLNFTVNYENINAINPYENILVTVRQNQRWDNVATNIKPSFFRDDQFELEYRFFDDSKMFKGGNEFRFFDLRSLKYPGQNIASVNLGAKPVQVNVATDVSRAGKPYEQYLDMNGGYIIQNLDYNSKLAANYANVNFRLQSPRLSGDVYLIGAFTNWELDKTTRLYYDSAQSAYRGQFLLKQGYYNYQYRVASATLPPSYVEGSHYETENLYEIFVYYRSFQPQADLLVGYYVVDENQR